MLALTTSYAQSDDVYYSNNNAYAYSSSSSYDNSYDNSYNNSYQDYNESYQTFYDAMSPYGSWVYNPRYGYVWRPALAAAGFSPYLTGGHWTYSEYGWTWVSDYAWGWAAFHYGRWFHDDMYGWMWTPGSEWAPAWVMWGSYSNNYCWAPIAPGYGYSSYYRPEARYWNVVGCGQINQPYLNNYVAYHDGVNNTVVNHNVSVTNINVTNITIINNYNTYNNNKFFAGPRVNDVERATGHKIAAVTVTAANKPAANRISGNQLEIYRPAIKSTMQNNNGIQRQNGTGMNRTMDEQRANNMQRSISTTANNVNTQKVAQQRPMEQNQVQRVNERNFSQPERQQTMQPAKQPISQPVRENMQQQRAKAQPERQIQFSQPVQRQQVSEPARENTPQQRTFSQPVRENTQPQRTFSQPVRQTQMSQPVQKQQERRTATMQMPVQQQTSHQAAPVSRGSFGPVASRGKK
ncbi:MAG: hypothetical protein JWO03_1405 [Bacteroidetes bacterium]|nr:hypothetical protein [Bacteroidota bacterium]